MGGTAGGRAPKSNALRVLEGLRGHRPLRQEPITQGVPPPPRWLAAEGRRLWRRTVPELQRMGLLGRIDEIALVQLCQTWAAWVDVERELASASDVADVDRLRRQTSRLKGDLMAVLKEYGMTPVSRARVAKPQVLEDETLGGLLR